MPPCLSRSLDLHVAPYAAYVPTAASFPSLIPLVVHSGSNPGGDPRWHARRTSPSGMDRVSASRTNSRRSSLSSRPLGALLIRPIRGRDSMREGNEWPRGEHSMRPSANYGTLVYPVIVVSLPPERASLVCAPSPISRGGISPGPLGINYN